MKATPLPPPLMPIPSTSSTSHSIWPRLTFTQGVLLGQLSMVVLAVLFLRYVVFEDPDQAKREKERISSGENQSTTNTATEGELSRRKKRRRMRTNTETKLNNSTSNGPLNSTTSATDSATSILNSLSYDLSSHSPESLDWLNVLIAQLLSSYRLLASNHLAGGARGLIEEALNRKVRPHPSATTEEVEDEGGSAGLIGLDEIEVEEVELGEGFPQLSDARVRPSGNEGEGLRVELDLDYTDKVSLSLSTRVVMNFPRPRFAVLPVSLSLTLQRFSGTVTIELPTPTTTVSPEPPSSSDGAPAPSHPHQHPSIHLSLHPDFTLDLSTSSLLGSRAKLEDVPKVEQLLNARIRSVIQDRVVWPGRVEIALPGIHPHQHQHHHSHQRNESETVPGGAGGGGGDMSFEAVDDWTVVDRPHPLACPNENLPSSFSISDFKHREADSEDEDDEDDSEPLLRQQQQHRPLSPLQRRSGFLSSTPPLTSDPTLKLAQETTRDDHKEEVESNGSTETPSVDFGDPEGPTISLHPKIRNRSSQSQSQSQSQQPSSSSRIRKELNLENLKYLDQSFKNRSQSGGGGGKGRPSSPTESFPGYFPGTRTPGGLATGVGVGLTAGGTAGGGGGTTGTGTRFRGNIGGVGLSSR
ncbi:ERMES complex subunit MMM1 [Sporobolomyces salmoneus]|uniref:ERMES complex subunit MMM1 n=1 Tax=Sporobolomyces salmoneus TaxID=183962 RepID=UPI00317052AD